MRATAVIGANYGDEGKGLICDYLVSKASGPTLVVRFNGGAQAGHTVLTPTGQRHVFHHFGSGTLLGAATYLSRFFVANPMVWKTEKDELAQLGVYAPKVYVALDTPITTPYDMLVNQEAERIRGGERHGSCGLGIHETLERNTTDFATTVRTITRGDVERIRGDWALKRLIQLVGNRPFSEAFYSRLFSNSLLEHYLGDLEAFLGSVHFREAFPKGFEDIVFEGAQGLLLDEDHPNFPYVTHSKTGLHNVLILCREAGISELDAVYVTRAYVTRHGAGPFPTEVPGMLYADLTNVRNEFQGGLRFGTLDPYELLHNVSTDLSTRGSMNVVARIALTCLDQIRDPGEVEENLSGIVPIGLRAYGPTRAHIYQAKEQA